VVRFPPWPGIFFKPARCGYTLRVTSQASYSPEYTTPTQQISTWESVANYRKANKNKNLFENYVLRPVLNLTLMVITYGLAH
jgi:hypothetical protein